MRLKNNSLLKVVALVAISLFLSTAQSIEIDGSGNKHGSIKSLYLFNETSGDILDHSGTIPALDLEIENSGATTRTNSHLKLSQDTVIRSKTAASKIVNACNTSNEFTIELWVNSNRSANPPEVLGINPIPLTILSLSQPDGSTSLQFSQFYDAGEVFQIRFGGATVDSNKGIVEIDQLQHIYLTKNSDGLAKLYVGTDSESVTLRQSFMLAPGVNFNPGSLLTYGNKADYNPNQSASKRFSWKGDLHMGAVYCNALTDEEVTGIKPIQKVFASFKIDPNKEITINHRRALLLYKRLVGASTPIDNPIIDQMATRIANNNFEGAANLATGESGFYNVTVRDFAARMSTRDETVNSELNDFVAGIIGATRDGLSAKELLTGNFYYAADPAKVNVPGNMITDILKSNNHYKQLDEQGYDLAQVLRRYNGQKLFNGLGGVVDNPNPAGLLTSRAFMAAHAIAGTNRRLVEFTFREFLCVDMEQWSDATGPDNLIGKDVDRFPGGEHSKFKVSCRSCHSNMDGLRGAFAKFTFSAGFLKNSFVIPPGPGGDNEDSMAQNPIGVAAKYNQNDDVFPGGHTVTNDSFINHATRGANATYFGWGDKKKGQGVKEFGEMVADAKAFPQCLTKRAFRSVCKREPASFDMPMIDKVSTEFSSAGYNLRTLFEKVAVSKECLGPMSAERGLSSEN